MELVISKPMDFLHHISKVNDYDIKAQTIGRYLLQVSVLEWQSLVTSPSLMAAASTWLARLILGNYTQVGTHSCVH